MLEYKIVPASYPMKAADLDSWGENGWQLVSEKRNERLEQGASFFDYTFMRHKQRRLEGITKEAEKADDVLKHKI